MRRFQASLLQFNPLDRSPTFFAIGMLIGAVWYLSIGFEPALAAVAAAAGLTAVVLWSTLRLGAPGVSFVLALVLCGAATGALAGGIAAIRAAQPQLTAPIGPVLLEGWISRADPAKRGVRLVIAVHAIDGVPVEQTPRRVRVTQISRLETEPGRFVRCWAVLRPPPAPVIEGDYAFDRQAWFSGLGGVGYVQGRCRGGALGPPAHGIARLKRQIAQARRQLARHVRAHAGDRAGGFAAALASGDRSFMSAEDQDRLRRAGLAHLLAISGLHMGIVGGLVYLIVWRGLALIEPVALRLNVRKPAALAALIACGLYLVMSGASVSTQRAFIMALILFGAVLADRTALSQRSLALAMILVIALAPWSVLTPGFQMSFAATGALIATYEAWQRRRRTHPGLSQRGPVFWLKSLCVTSIVSSFATMPFALYHFDRVAGLGILANLVAMPIVSLFSAPLAAASMLLAPFGLDHWALRGFGLSLEAVLSVADLFSDRAGGDRFDWPRMPASSLAMLAAALVILCVGRGRTVRFLAAGLVSIGAFAIWAVLARNQVHWAPSGDLYLERASGQVRRVDVHDGAGLGALRYNRLPEQAMCAPGELCQLDFGGTQIVYIPAGADPPCEALFRARLILLAEEHAPCDPLPTARIVSWSHVTRENGVTLEWHAGAFHKQPKPPCGRRPWRPCRRSAYPD